MLQTNGLPANHTSADIPRESAELNVAGPPIPVRIQYAAVKELHSTTNRGGVIGLLLGSSLRQSISIEHCEALSGDTDILHTNPDQYQKAAEQLIGAALQDLPGQASKFLGFFRTESAGWLELSEWDRELAKRYLPPSGGLFLLIRTSEHRPWSAALFSYDSNVFPKSLAPALRFPFDEYLLRNGYSAAPLPAALDPSSAAARPAIVIPRPFMVWAGIAAGFVLLVLLGIAAFRSRPAAPAASAAAAQPSAPGTGPLGLQVNRAGNDFEISWDRFAAAVQRAQTGVLSIQDGDMSRNLYLAPEQLREGRIIYSSASPNLDFRLAVTNGKDTQAESVELLRPDNLPSSSRASARLRAGNSRPLLLNQSGSDSRVSIPRAGPPASSSAALAAAGAGNNPPATPDSGAASPEAANPSQAPKSFQVPTPAIIARALPAATIPAPPAPPHVAPGVPSDLITATGGASVPLPPPSAIESPQKPPLEVSHYVAPRPLTRVNPSISAQARAAIKDSAELVVSVTLDDTGKVTGAQAGQVTGVANHFFQSYFQQQARDAAKRWTFTPSMLNGKRVASEFDVHFVFKP